MRNQRRQQISLSKPEEEDKPTPRTSRSSSSRRIVTPRQSPVRIERSTLVIPSGSPPGRNLVRRRKDKIVPRKRIREIPAFAAPKTCRGGGRAVTSRNLITRGAIKISGRKEALLVLLLSSIALLIWVYFFSGTLNINEIEVRGNRRLETSYIRALSGVGENTNLIWANSGAIISSLKQDPWVEEVRVSKKFPSRLVLEVKEREPVFQIHSNLHYYLVDENGFVISAEERSWPGLPQLFLPQALELEITSVLEGEDFHSAEEVLEHLPERLRPLLVAVSVTPEGRVTMHTGPGYSIILGPIEDLDRKMELAVLIVEEVVGKYRNIEYIDLSIPENPVIKPR